MKAVRDIAEKLTAARKATGINQRELAQRLGTVQSHISEMEAGGAINVTTLIRWADVLGYEVIVRPKRE